MIDPDTIEEVDDCDGEAVLAYGYNPVSKAWEWAWVQMEELAEAGRTDIIERLFA